MTLDAYIRALFELQELSNGVSERGAVLLDAAFKEISGLLVQFDPTEVAKRYQQMRVERFMGESTPVLTGAHKELWKQMRADLTAIGAQRSKWAAATHSFRSVVGPDRFRTILDEDPFEGLTLRQWTEGMNARTIMNLRKQIQLGMVRGETIDQLVKRIRGPLEVGTVDGARALARTATNFIANRAHLETFRANGVQEVRFAAILDDRTTLLCASLDGTVWKLEVEDSV